MTGKLNNSLIKILIHFFQIFFHFQNIREINTSKIIFFMMRGVHRAIDYQIWKRGHKIWPKNEQNSIYCYFNFLVIA